MTRRLWDEGLDELVSPWHLSLRYLTPEEWRDRFDQAQADSDAAQLVALDRRRRDEVRALQRLTEDALRDSQDLEEDEHMELRSPYLIATCADGRMPFLLCVAKLQQHGPAQQASFELAEAATLLDQWLDQELPWLVERDQVLLVWNDSVPPDTFGLGRLPWVYPTDREEVNDDRA